MMTKLIYINPISFGMKASKYLKIHKALRSQRAFENVQVKNASVPDQGIL